MMSKHRAWLVPALLLSIGAAPGSSPVDVVQRQVDTFNKGDLDGFVACYADNVEVYALGSTIIPAIKGRAAFLQRYTPVFRPPHPRVTILSRMASGGFVVDKERTEVAGRVEEGLAVYEVKDGRIARVWFTP